MRSPIFDSNAIRKHLRRHRIAAMPELKRVLGTSADLTVIRKLKSLGYCSSYTHRGAYYTLREIPRFGDSGLWSHEGVWFSRHGRLLDTAEAFIQASAAGFFADELADALHVEVQDALRKLTGQGRLSRTTVHGRYLYTAADPHQHRRQIRMRQSAEAVPVAVQAGGLQVSPHELQAAILLFYSLLDEQQRRLYAGLESLRLGHGGDTILGDFLALDPRTVARGRQQLLEQDVTPRGRTRRTGGGRIATEKKRPKSSP